MPNAVSNKWWLKLSFTEQAALSKIWNNLGDTDREKLKARLKPLYERYRYLKPNEDIDYYFYLSYWPQSVDKLLQDTAIANAMDNSYKGDRGVDKLSTRWWCKLTSGEQRKIIETWNGLRSDNQYIFKHTFTQRCVEKNYFLPSPSSDIDYFFYLSYWSSNLPKTTQSASISIDKRLSTLARASSVTLPRGCTHYPIIDLQPTLIISAQSYRRELTLRSLGARVGDNLPTILASGFLGLIGICSAGASVFTFKKIYDAFHNLYQKRKVKRSLWRLAGIGGGGYGGWIAAGFILSTVFPGVGNLTYVIIAMLVVSLACVMGERLAKYSAQALSWLKVKLGFYQNQYIANPTNPDLYLPKVVANAPITTIQGGVPYDR